MIMSDNELSVLRKKRLQELQRKFAPKEESKEVSADKVLERVFKDRAWEVFNSASAQFPEVMDKIKDALVKLVLSGKVTEISGEQLYFLLRSLGLRVKLNTRIDFAGHGKMKTLAEKLKEDL
jgi:DNA-binding TFAR19-related protein (PDSD5 family)